MMVKEIDLTHCTGRSHMVWSEKSGHEEELLWNLSLHLIPGLVYLFLYRFLLDLLSIMCILLEAGLLVNNGDFSELRRPHLLTCSQEAVCIC